MVAPEPVSGFEVRNLEQSRRSCGGAAELRSKLVVAPELAG